MSLELEQLDWDDINVSSYGVALLAFTDECPVLVDTSGISVTGITTFTLIYI